MKRTMFFLDQKDMPTKWYNILPDLPVALPEDLHPATGKPVTPDDLAPLFPMELIMQEFSPERYIEIPEEVQDILLTWRPTVLHRAYKLEKALDTPAKIFYKYEGTSPAGSHKLNTAVPQAYYNKKEGVKRISTETGAGQWGSALSIACSFFDIECKVYMVKVSFNGKPYRRIMMETYGATCVASPSMDTKAGREMLAKDPNCNGSLGLAISEAVEDAVSRDDTHYALGSVLNHVLLHQTIIGEETIQQMEMAGEYPDILVGCVGGGSNFAGLFIPWLRDKISGKKPNTRVICVEPTATPTLTKGPYAYDYGDVAGLTPLLKMYTLGHDFMPPPVHAGGLRYHGMAPIVSHLYNLGIIEAQAVPQLSTFEAGVLFARTEGILSAPESTHAIKVAIDEAVKCRESGESKNILICLSGHGHFDLSSYDAYLQGKLSDLEFPEDKMKEALDKLPKVG
ncbi:MAG: TrpB-like pyridoxal phosphate-dependent enzyme [Dehalococcoidales bacterium]|jgi:tryptophan synthase beta chain|nr:TrpB-like pyridoxal phosphate-dependent enzyme [Dehalococcoidales bacterium]MDD3994483.1 TrpB-like pyridoxal phosphate-dependent enzyme [Dehalococcoidales bacterium]NLT27562.1 TrpB-like pyridoxal phosphate-dependent enzyme [Dehalococcoidales bacterium]